MSALEGIYRGPGADRLSPPQRPSLRTRIDRAMGRHNDSNLFWSAPSGRPYNFGDWIGPYLFHRITGRAPVLTRTSVWPGVEVFFTVGSITAYIRHPGQAIVWGSGIMARNRSIARPKRICAVRGPLTRSRCIELGYDCPPIYGDPAILLPQHIPPRPGRRQRLGLIPHYVHLDEARRLYGGRDDLTLIDVRQPVEAVVEAIQDCEATISSSLHGIIVSHAYGVPSRQGRFSADLSGDGTKFADYYAAAEVSSPPEPVDLIEVGTTDILLAHVRQAPLPDLAPLLDPLRTACPFERDSHG